MSLKFSRAEPLVVLLSGVYLHYRAAARHTDQSFEREALAPGVTASPQDDLIFRGGKVVPQMGFQNIYLSRSSDFAPGDIESIDDAITRIMLDEQLKNIVQQYFPGQTLSYDVAESVILDEARPNEMGEDDVQDKIIDLFDRGLILATDHDRTCFNLVLPPETILTLVQATPGPGPLDCLRRKERRSKHRRSGVQTSEPPRKLLLRESRGGLDIRFEPRRFETHVQDLA